MILQPHLSTVADRFYGPESLGHQELAAHFSESQAAEVAGSVIAIMMGTRIEPAQRATPAKDDL